jgi:hypothetical protein
MAGRTAQLKYEVLKAPLKECIAVPRLAMIVAVDRLAA